MIEIETGAPAKAAPESKMMQAALYYAARFNFSVLPCCERGKAPITPKGVKDATRDYEIIRQWWTQFPAANLGIACGAASGGLVVLDIDGPEGEESLRSLGRQFGELPVTPQVLTGKGVQYYFRSVRELKNRVRVAPGIDIRADAGYVLAPPSIHPNGRTYVWEISQRIDEIPLADIPSWLEYLIKEPKQKERSPETFWRNLVFNGVSEGSRNASVAKLAGHLLRRYVDPVLVCGLLSHWNRSANNPPLPEQELLKTIDSVAGIEARRRNQKQ